LRRFVATLLALLLGGCIPIPMGNVHVRTQHIAQGVVAASQVAAVALTIRQRLAAAWKAIKAQHARLRPTSCGAAKCYAAADVDNAIAAIRERVRAAIPSEALPLQKAVADEIERATTLGAPLPPSAIQHIRVPPEAAGGGYDAEEVDGMFRHVLAYLDSIGKYESYTPSVEFRSAPDGATYEIQVADARLTTLTGSTNETVPTVWRGIYSGFARKAGYKDARIAINLMNNKPRATCTCTLYKTATPIENASACRTKW
jgi:hypothetical protein